jgi:hypothetical protein
MATVPDPKHDPEAAQRRMVAAAVQQADLQGTQAWQQLTSLTPHFEIDGIEAEPEGVLVSGNNFRGALSLYVILDFQPNQPQGSRLETSESFLGHFSGHFVGEAPVIEDVQLKLEPFFA